MEPTGSGRITRALLNADEFSIPSYSSRMDGHFSESSSSSTSRHDVSSSAVSDEGIDVADLKNSNPLTFALKPRHSLPSSWTFWFSSGDRRLSWKENQKKIGTVSTIEDFWFVYNQVKHVSHLPAGYTYSVFKKGILPDREDALNKKGGKWIASFPKKDRALLDSRWLDILCLLLGEHHESCVSINGAEAFLRMRSDKIDLWVGESFINDALKIGRLFKSKLAVDHNSTIQYKIHKENEAASPGPNLLL